MGKIITLYHGSDKIIEKPKFGKGKAHKDFGMGFYCTENEDFAKEWGCSSIKDGFANKYTLDTANLKILRLNSKDYTILNWLAVVVQNRLFRIKTPIAGSSKKYLLENFYVNVNDYDAIVGCRADDYYFDYVELFLNNGITVKQLAHAMQLGKLGEQFVIKSEYAFSLLNFEGVSTAERQKYCVLRKARNDDAELSYQNISGEHIEGIYMTDIIRGEIKNGDARIPRNIS